MSHSCQHDKDGYNLLHPVFNDACCGKYTNLRLRVGPLNYWLCADHYDHWMTLPEKAADEEATKDLLPAKGIYY